MKNISFLFGAALIPFALAAKPASENAAAPYVSGQAEATISSIYPDARNLRWEDNDGDIYTAYFTESGARTVASVADNGDLISVLTYYNARQTPRDLRSVLVRKYPGKSITGVTKYEEDGGDFPDITYQATLQDAGHWYIVTIDGTDVRTKQILDKA